MRDIFPSLLERNRRNITFLIHLERMQERILSNELAAYVGQTVTICGWIHRSRNLGALTFIVLRDRQGIAQLVCNQTTVYNNESVIAAAGQVVANPKAPGGFELQVAQLKLLSSPTDGNLPLAVHGEPASVGLNALLANRYLSLRYPAIREIFVVQALVLKYFAHYMRSQDFIEIKSSKIIGSGTEGGSGLFALDYFGEPAFLAQSPQFYKQAMVASGMERVFEIGAAYRAEKHDTPRHLNEYVSLDVEVGFIESESELMDLEIGILTAICEGLRQECGTILERRHIVLPAEQEFRAIPRISYEEALAIIEEQSNSAALEINPEGERLLSQWAAERHGIEALFVHSFPRKKRPFYTAYEGRHTRSFDCIFRGLEITTGGMRIHHYDTLLEALPKFGMQESDVADYLTIFKYGCPPHGGFALGLERLTQKLLNLTNVKEASLFPRDRSRLRP